MTQPTITEQLAEMISRIEALEVRATIETNGLATSDSVSDLSKRVDALEALVGKPTVSGAP